MGLAKMFFNTYAGNSEINLKSSVSSASIKKQPKDSFESYLDRAEDKSYSKTENQKTSKTKSYETKSDADQSKEITKPENSDAEKSVGQSDPSQKEKAEDSKSVKKSELKKDDNSSVSEKAEDAQKLNEEIVKAIADKTGLSIDEINAALEKAGLEASDLIDANNLLSFMMALTDVESPIDLISVDGVKDIMSEIKNVFEESEKFADFASNQAKLEENLKTSEIKQTDIVKADENQTDISSEKLKTDTNAEITQAVSLEEVDLSETKNRYEKNSDKNFVYQEEKSADNLNVVVSASGAEKDDTGGFFQNQSFLSKGESSQVNVAGVVMDNITKALNEAVLRTESTKNVDTAEIIKQIIDKVKVGINKDVTELKISLKPEELGDVTLRIASHNGIVTAQITAESQRVKEIIEAGFNQLKQALSDAGVEVSQLEVNVGSGESDADFKNQYSANEKTSSRVSQIIAQSEQQEEVNYVKENEVVGANVNYTA